MCAMTRVGPTSVCTSTPTASRKSRESVWRSATRLISEAMTSSRHGLSSPSLTLRRHLRTASTRRNLPRRASTRAPASAVRCELERSTTAGGYESLTRCGFVHQGGPSKASRQCSRKRSGSRPLESVSNWVRSSRPR